MDFDEWLDKHFFEPLTFKLWDISDWFFFKGYIKISDYIILKIESPISRRWTIYRSNKGWKPKPLSEDAKAILGSAVKGYFDMTDEDLEAIDNYWKNY